MALIIFLIALVSGSATVAVILATLYRAKAEPRVARKKLTELTEIWLAQGLWTERLLSDEERRRQFRRVEVTEEKFLPELDRFLETVGAITMYSFATDHGVKTNVLLLFGVLSDELDRRLDRE